jgi:hypothetical protein
MSIFVVDHHFLNDLFEILINCLDRFIHFRFVRGRVEMFNHPFGAEFNN